MSIQKEIEKKIPELKKYLLKSIKLKKEIAGAYKITNQPIDFLELILEMRYGNFHSVYNDIKAEVLVVPFHTHLHKYDPPSGHDIIAMLYRNFKQESELSIVIDLNAV